MTTRPLRVVLVHNRYRSDQPSGEDRVVDREAAALSEAGHSVTILERRSDDIAALSPCQRLGVVLRVPWNGSARRAVREYLRSDRPDVVHVHNTFPLLSWAVAQACADAGVPAVATLHNFRLVCAAGTFYRSGRICTDCADGSSLPAVRHGCYRDSRAASVPLAASTALHRRRSWTGVDPMLCLSEAQRRLLVAAGVPPERIRVKHNFVPEPANRRTGSGDHVLYLGRLAPEKGVTDLMEAWDVIASDGGVGLPLVVAGAGPLAGDVARWARDRTDVRFVGLATSAESDALTARAAAVVAPSRWPETFGLVAVEAMAAGVPAVVAESGAFPELVHEGVTGHLHPAGDVAALARSVRRAVDDPLHNRALGTAARRRYEHDFTPAAGVAALEEAYEDAIASCLPSVTGGSWT